nr:thioredoxin family protein [Bacillus suaedaesalsae]
MANYFGFKVLPNGIFIGKDLSIRFIHQGFHITNPEHVEAIRKLIYDEAETLTLDQTYYNPAQLLTAVEKQLVETKFKLGLEYLNNGKKELALKELDEALLIDPDNFLIRKQRWYIRHPEKFAPTIDIEWQQATLEQERIHETSLNGENCGPEGCTIPGTTKE